MPTIVTGPASLGIALVLGALVAGCHNDGFTAWAMNGSGEPVVVRLSGEDVFDVDRPTSAYVVPPDGRWYLLPFVTLGLSEDDQTQDPGEIAVLTANCDPVRAFGVGTGGYRLTIGPDGTVALQSFAVLGKPVDAIPIEGEAPC